MEAKIQIPDIIGQKMRKHKLIDWNESVAKELILQVSERDLVEEILSRSTLTEKDAKEISEKIKGKLADEHYPVAVNP